MSALFKGVVDNRNQNSLANRMRRRRFALFVKMLDETPKPARILDVGGTQNFWRNVGLNYIDNVEVTLLNIQAEPVNLKNFVTLAGDGRAMPQFKTGEFDIVFSNSTIEHVGDYEDQRCFADEVQRVGKRYIVQTPNKYFPIEPHFVFPMFQFLPVSICVWLLTHFNLGWYKKFDDPEAAKAAVESIRLMGKNEFQTLFPGSKLYRERVLGLTKSFIVYK